MVAAFYSDLESCLSPERLAPFRDQNTDDLTTAVNYFWNVALSQALYPSLSLLEVATRNRLHAFLTVHLGRPDWYDAPNFLQTRELTAITRAKNEIRDAGKRITPGRVVAALMFGFWVSLLDALYGDSQKGPRLWGPFPSPQLTLVFPSAPAGYQPYRGRLHARLDDMRLLRNRISHYEPIWKGMSLPSRKKRTPPRLVTLHDLHAEVIETIGWLSPTMETTVATLDLFPMTEQKGRAGIERRLKRQLGIL